MAEKIPGGGYRERIAFSDEAWARFEAAAKALAMDTRTLIRVFASLQLVQWETMIAGAAQSASVQEAVRAELDRRAAELIGDLTKQA